MTQKEKILKHLKESSITSFEAFTRYKITRLADRIFQLKKDGHKIVTEIVKKNKTRFARYTLIK